MLKNILAVIGAVTVAAVAYVAFSDHVIVKIEPMKKALRTPKSRKNPKSLQSLLNHRKKSTS